MSITNRKTFALRRLLKLSERRDHSLSVLAQELILGADEIFHAADDVETQSLVTTRLVRLVVFVGQWISAVPSMRQ